MIFRVPKIFSLATSLFFISFHSSYAQPADYIPPSVEETSKVAACLENLGHPELVHEDFIRSKIYGQDTGEDRVETPDGYVEFIVPKQYWASKFSPYTSDKVFMFTIPYSGIGINGTFHTSNSTINPVPAVSFMLAVWGHFKDSQDYLNHILDNTPVPESYIQRMDGTPFEETNELVEYDYSNPGFMSKNHNFFLKGSAQNPELLMECTTRSGKICESWTNLPGEDIQDRIKIRFHQTFINNAHELSKLLEYTEQTFSCMRPNQ